MRTVKLALSVILVLLLAGCVMVRNEDWIKLQQDINALKKDNEDVQKAKEAFRLQSEDARVAIEALKSEIQEVQKSTSGQLSARISATEGTLSSLEKELRKKQADITAEITSIRSDFQILTGRFEEVRYATQKSAQEDKLSKDDVDLRYKEIVQRAEDLQKRIASLEQSLALIRQEKEPNVKEKTGEASGFEDAYKDAYEAYQKGDYKTSREKFQRYLEAFPNSKYSENAQYWIGESYYKEKNYERAIVEFDDVVKKYPDGSKAPAALFKQGMAFSSLGDKKNAKIIFKKVVERYPKSEQAEMAKKKLEE